MRIPESFLYVKNFQKSTHDFFYTTTWHQCNTVIVVIPFSVVYWGHLSSKKFASFQPWCVPFPLLYFLIWCVSTILAMQSIMRLAIKLNKALFPLNDSYLLIKSKIILFIWKCTMNWNKNWIRNSGKKKKKMAFDVYKRRKNHTSVCVHIPLGQCFSNVLKGLCPDWECSILKTSK